MHVQQFYTHWSSWNGGRGGPVWVSMQRDIKQKDNLSFEGNKSKSTELTVKQMKKLNNETNMASMWG